MNFGYNLDDLPDDVLDLTSRDLKTLVENDEILLGLRDSLPSAKERYGHFLSLSEKNRRDIQNIKKSLKQVNDNEDELERSQETERESYHRWIDAESQMYQKSRPYSRVGIENALRKEFNNHSYDARKLQADLSSSDTSSQDAARIAKDYLAKMERVHETKAILDSI